MKEGSKKRSLGCNGQPLKRLVPWLAHSIVLFGSATTIPVVEGRTVTAFGIGQIILIAVVVGGIQPGVEGCQRFHPQNNVITSTSRWLGLESSDDTVDCPLSTEIYQLKYNPTLKQYVLPSNEIHSTIDMINTNSPSDGSSGQPHRHLKGTEQATRNETIRSVEPKELWLNKNTDDVPRNDVSLHNTKTSIQFHSQQHFFNWMTRKSVTRSLQEVATNNPGTTISNRTKMDNNETTIANSAIVELPIKVRACQCSNTYPVTYCLAQFNTCSVDTKDGSVKCYNGRSNIKTFWPIVIIWVFGVAIIFVRGELARNAYGFFRRKFFFLRNYREVSITIPPSSSTNVPNTTAISHSPAEATTNMNNETPQDQQQNHEAQQESLALERNNAVENVHMEENNNNDQNGNTRVEGEENSNVPDTMVVRIRMTEEEQLYQDLLELTEREPQRVGYLYQNVMVRERIYRQRARERRRRMQEQERETQSHPPHFWSRLYNPRPSLPSTPSSLPLQVSIQHHHQQQQQQNHHQPPQQQGRFSRSSSVRSLQDRMQRSSSIRSLQQDRLQRSASVRTLPVQRSSSLRSLQMQRSSSARSVQSERFQRSSSARSLQANDQFQRSSSARSLQGGNRSSRISNLSPSDSQLQRSSSVRFRDDEENNNPITINNENDNIDNNNELVLSGRRQRLTRWFRRVLGQPRPPLSNPDNTIAQDTDQMSDSLDSTTPRLLLKTTIYRKRHQIALATIYDESHNSSISFGGNGHFVNDAPMHARNYDAFLRTSLHSPSHQSHNVATPSHDTNNIITSQNRNDSTDNAQDSKPSWQTVVSSLLPGVAATTSTTTTTTTTATAATSKPTADHKTLEEMDAEVDDGIRCAICITRLEEGDVIGEIRCGHVFHKDCLKDWLRRKNRCPLCQRSDIAKFVDPAIQTNVTAPPNAPARPASNDSGALEG